MEENTGNVPTFDACWKGEYEQNMFIETDLRADESLGDPIHISGRAPEEGCLPKWARKNRMRYLQNAGAWQEQELLEIYREGLLRLKELYKAQRRHLWLEMKEKRRKYLFQVLEASNQKTLTPSLMESLSAPSTQQESVIEKYSTFHGEEGLVARKSFITMAELSIEKLSEEKQSRLVIGKPKPAPGANLDYQEYSKFLGRIQSALASQPSNADRCRVKNCIRQHLPRSNYCISHIMRDTEQCLFVKCSHEGAESCENIVSRTEAQTLCILHRTIPECNNSPPIQ
ncbi:hypothetical protein LOD99_12801 [Oopsacas minuta]|uniref:KAT8 regulatory NSL complex subunit 2 n=1 Tax=Oopsacas minuta TaxID=111878 RepID=A0AAV7JD25_9METZ|nr:hypothetical protein LOD99_12801 [Oopsacas minuta]